MVFDQAIFTVVVIKVSFLYFRFSNSKPICTILLHCGKTLQAFSAWPPCNHTNISVIFPELKKQKILTQGQYLGTFESR